MSYARTEDVVLFVLFDGMEREPCIHSRFLMIPVPFFKGLSIVPNLILRSVLQQRVNDGIQRSPYRPRWGDGLEVRVSVHRMNELQAVHHVGLNEREVLRQRRSNRNPMNDAPGSHRHERILVLNLR